MYVDCRHPGNLAPPLQPGDVLPVDPGPVRNPVMVCFFVIFWIHVHAAQSRRADKGARVDLPPQAKFLVSPDSTAVRPSKNNDPAAHQIKQASGYRVKVKSSGSGWSGGRR